MRFKMKLGLPLFFLTFFVVMACSLGAVSAANNIHDIKVDDMNTEIHHFDANIQDSNILNTVVDTDYTKINEADSNGVSIIGSSIKNIFAHSGYTSIEAADYGTGIGLRNSAVNNIVAESENTYIATGVACWYDYQAKGIVENSNINNVVSGSEQTLITIARNENSNNDIPKVTNCDIKNTVESSITTAIYQGSMKESDNSSLTNTISNSENAVIVQDDIHNSQITNTNLFSNKTWLFQGYAIKKPEEFEIQPVNNCNLNNLTLCCENTIINETNLSGVNGVMIAIGCHDYTKTIENLTDTNFFNLTIDNLEIFNFHW